MVGEVTRSTRAAGSGVLVLWAALNPHPHPHPKPDPNSNPTVTVTLTHTHTLTRTIKLTKMINTRYRPHPPTTTQSSKLSPQR